MIRYRWGIPPEEGVGVVTRLELVWESDILIVEIRLVVGIPVLESDTALIEMVFVCNTLLVVWERDTALVVWERDTALVVWERDMVCN